MNSPIAFSKSRLKDYTVAKQIDACMAALRSFELSSYESIELSGLSVSRVAESSFFVFSVCSGFLLSN